MSTSTHRGTASHDPSTLPLDLAHIVFERDGRRILDDVSLRVPADEHWVVLGANGSGKTTLLRIAAMYEHPSAGDVRVLGEVLGRTDVRRLRRRIGYASAKLATELRDALTAADVVMTAKYAALEPWWHTYDDADRARARDCLGRMGVGSMAERSMGTLSSGEQQRVLLARTLMNDPAVILLDEPSARLDLGGREQLVGALAELAGHADAPFVLVTHHVDEIPAGVSHALLLRDGRPVAQGPIDEALTAETLSDCFGMPLALERRPDGRLAAWARR
jgi:iron complex transport system ATP-binding protein